LAKKVAQSVQKDMEQQLRYYNSLSGSHAEGMAEEKRAVENYLQGMKQMETMYNPRIQIPGKLMAPSDSVVPAKDTGKKK
jgi:hypothetical protein